MASSWVDWKDLWSAVTWGESMARKTVELMAESMVIQTPVTTDDSTVALLVEPKVDEMGGWLVEQIEFWMVAWMDGSKGNSRGAQTVAMMAA
jgi:hypothetical protein